MKLNIGLAQCRHTPDNDPLSLVRSFAKKAKASGVDLLVFPESLMTPYEKDRGAFLNEAQPITGSFVSSVNDIAREHSLALVYTFNEKNPDGNPFNTAVLTAPDGTTLSSYRKVHLFDSDTTQESDRMAAGSKLFEPVWVQGAIVGIGICYDLRFPEVARYAALHGAQLMLYPAAWVAGERKIEQWQTLLRARAIENEMYVAGLSRCDEGYIGHSCIFDPRGDLLASADDSEQLIMATIDSELIDQTRRALPVFDHRKPELYKD